MILKGNHGLLVFSIYLMTRIALGMKRGSSNGAQSLSVNYTVSTNCLAKALSDRDAK